MCRDFDLSVVNCIAGSRFCPRLCANRKQDESYSSVSKILCRRTTSDETLAESVAISYRCDDAYRVIEQIFGRRKVTRLNSKV